jgi:DNA-binding IclR family transcriptional regulator
MIVNRLQGEERLNKPAESDLALARPLATGVPRFKGKIVGAALNAVKILQYLSNQVAPVPLAQIARELELIPSTCFHILHTLARENLASYDPVRKEYLIGFGVLSLARGAALRGGDISMVRPLLERVAHKHDLTVSLWRPISDSDMLLILVAFGPGGIRVHLNVGYTRAIAAGSAGRIMAAYLNPSARLLRRQFNAVRWNRPLPFEKYQAQVARARSRGWAVDERHLLKDAASVSVPVFDHAGQFVMACAGTMLASRYNDEAASALAADLAAAAREIARVPPVP